MIEMQKYIEALEEFLMKMAQIPDLNTDDIGRALENLCGALRIASVEASFYDSPTPGGEEKGQKLVFYQEERRDEKREFLQTEITGGGSFVVYRFCQRPLEDFWSKEEERKISLLAKMLFIFNGRVNVLQMMERNKGFLMEHLNEICDKVKPTGAMPDPVSLAQQFEKISRQDLE